MTTRSQGLIPTSELKHACSFFLQLTNIIRNFNKKSRTYGTSDLKSALLIDLNVRTFEADFLPQCTVDSLSDLPQCTYIETDLRLSGWLRHIT